MNKKRTKIEIIRDILTVIKNKNGKVKPTHILYKSNLSYQMMDEYLTELKKGSLIIEKQAKKGRTYLLTNKGFRFLDQYSLISDFMISFGLE